MTLERYLATAQDLALRAGAELLRHREAPIVSESKGVPRELVTAADRASERIVVGGLQRAFPDHDILAEEGVLTDEPASRDGCEWLWIVDPLDGTTNFVHGLPYYAVAVALAYCGAPVVGVVHAPALKTTYFASAGEGAYQCVGGGAPTRLHVSKTAACADALIATGFSYNRNEDGTDDNTERVAAVLPRCRDLRRLGSAELDLCLVAAGSFDAYWERYLQPYDVAAGAVLVREAGGAITDYAGGDNWLFGDSVVASNDRVHRELLGLLASARR
ncbi:MAG: inositol monophosphatase family protein [Planctomycetota bacterium]|nr:inositol monophosphatase family protein [Planctomycetota bacterium]